MKKIFLSSLAVLFSLAAMCQTTLTLDVQSCREMALAHNEDLMRAGNDARKAELDKQIALRSYLPKVDGTAMGTYMTDMPIMEGMELQMRGTYLAGINVVQPLYAGGKIIAGNKLARIGKECADENLRKTRMQVIADADNAYWTYISVGRKVRMLER